VPTYTVILNMLQNGASVGSTSDVFEADSAEHAEQQAIAAWRVARPDLTFTPLFTQQQQEA
jgi:hypothetical protein